MVKRICSLFLALCLICAVLPFHANAAGGSCGPDATWALSSNGILTISGTGPMTEFDGWSDTPWKDCHLDITHVVIQAVITTIGPNAFRNCANLTGVEIPATVTEIGRHAFVSSGLTHVTIPAGVTSIGMQAFDFCENLTGIHVESGNPAYYSDHSGVLFSRDNHLIQAPGKLSGHYAIPEGTVAIEKFGSCIHLTSVSIPASLTWIDSFAFLGCYNLNAFLAADSHPMFYSDNGVLFTRNNTGYFAPGNGLFLFPKGIEGTYTVPDGTEYLHSMSFIDSPRVTGITFPASVNRLGSQVFIMCPALSSLIFRGDAPALMEEEAQPPLSEVTATAYYPAGNETWTEEIRESYGGTITWVAYDPNGELPSEPSDPIEPEPMENPFVDVRESDYFYEPVLWAVAGNITGGIGNNRFGPNQSCTRGQIVTFLWAANGRPEPTSTENPFSDVKSSDYFYKAVLWAVENNITGGVGNGRFGPNQTCTRGQIVTFLWAAKGRPAPASGSNPFSDVKSSDYYYTAVLWAVENGITGGVGNGKFGPSQICTRGQIVTFLHKAYA